MKLRDLEKKLQRLKPKSDEQRAKEREQNRIRQANYRKRMQESGITLKKSKKSKPMTRNERESKRKYWREKQRESRGIRHSQKLRRYKEKDRAYRREKRSVNTQTDSVVTLDNDRSSVSSQSEWSDSAKRKAVSRSVKGLPKSPNKFAKAIEHIVKNATPNKQRALESIKVIDSNSKVKLNFLEKSANVINETLKKIDISKESICLCCPV